LTKLNVSYFVFRAGYTADATETLNNFLKIVKASFLVSKTFLINLN